MIIQFKPDGPKNFTVTESLLQYVNFTLKFTQEITGILRLYWILTSFITDLLNKRSSTGNHCNTWDTDKNRSTIPEDTHSETREGVREHKLETVKK